MAAGGPKKGMAAPRSASIATSPTTSEAGASLACPECNAPLRLAVASPQQTIGPWLIAVISCSLGLGFDAVVSTILTVVVTVAEPPSTRNEMFIAFMLLGGFLSLSLVCGGGVYALYRGRRAWSRMSLRKQRMRAVAIFIGVFVIHALWAVWLMIRL